MMILFQVLAKKFPSNVLSYDYESDAEYTLTPHSSISVCMIGAEPMQTNFDEYPANNDDPVYDGKERGALVV